MRQLAPSHSPRWLARLSAAVLSLSILPLLAPDVDQPDVLAPAGAPVASRNPRAVPAYRLANKVAVLTVHGEIDYVTYHSLERRIEQAVNAGADAIVLDIDTLGGRLDATLEICSLLKDPSITPPNTVAWIHPKAYSAGTIIALACREIVVAPNATFGDAAPIHGVPLAGIIQMAPTERAKVEMPLLSEVVESARQNHYDENLVQSFVSVGIELWLIENEKTGERVVVDRAEYETVFGDAPPQQLTRLTPSAAPGASTVSPKFDTTIRRPPPGEGVSLTPEQIRAQIEFQQQLPSPRQPLTEADRGHWRLVTQIVSDDRLLIVKQAEALFYGLAAATVGDDARMQLFFGASSLVRFEQSWSEHLVRFLTNPIVMGVLIAIFVLCLFIELAAPGVGVFGATAAVALLILIGAPFLAGMAQWWEILLIVLGLLLVLAEIFIIPGFGVAGIAGAICLLLGLIGVFVTDHTTPEGQEELWKGVASTLTALFAAAVGIWLISRQLDTSPLFGRLMLKAEVGSPKRNAQAPASLLQAMGQPQAALQIGDLGVAATDLRPAGRASFGSRIVDVQSIGRYIDKGTSIRVISVGRYVIEVEEAEA